MNSCGFVRRKGCAGQRRGRLRRWPRRTIAHQRRRIMAVAIGPVQLFLIGLDNDKLKGQIARALHEATAKENIRVLDALAIQKTATGGVVSLGGSDLTPDQREEYGAIIGGLMGFGVTGTEEG